VTYPELTRRYLSSAIDGFLLLVAGIAIAVTLQGEDTTGAVARVLLILALATSYEPVLTSRLCTVGQQVTGIRVRRYDDHTQRISLPRAYLRTAVKVVLGLYSFFAMGFNAERRAAHDLAVGSIVLNARVVAASPSAANRPTNA